MAQFLTDQETHLNGVVLVKLLRSNNIQFDFFLFLLPIYQSALVI